jgi:branched-subunit amino acid aminotransferase/4-amino-4-deoxychorismate lyase
MSGTAARITPVYKIEQYDLPKEKPIFTHLKENFEKIIF